MPRNCEAQQVSRRVSTVHVERFGGMTGATSASLDTSLRARHHGGKPSAEKPDQPDRPPESRETAASQGSDSEHARHCAAGHNNPPREAMGADPRSLIAVDARHMEPNPARM